MNHSSNEYEILASSSDAQKNNILDFTIHWYEDAIHSPADYLATSTSTGNEDNLKLDAYKKWVEIESSATATDDEKQKARLTMISSYALKTPNDYSVVNGVYALTQGGVKKVENARSNIEQQNFVSSSIASDVLAGAG